MEQEREPNALIFFNNNADKNAPVEENSQQGIRCEMSDVEFEIDLGPGKDEAIKSMKYQTDLREEYVKDIDLKLGSAFLETGKEEPGESKQNPIDVKEEYLNDKHMSKEIQSIIEKSSKSLEKDTETEKFIAQWKSCFVCKKMFESYILLEEHFKDIHNNKFCIKCCEKKINKSSDLLKHIGLHSKPDKYKCDICGKYRENRMAHKNSMHKKFVENFKCKVCGKVFNKKVCLERHITCHTTISKDFTCEKCGMGYVLESQLTLHMKTHHHVCDHCKVTFNSTVDLKKHLLEHTGNEELKYPCTKCDAQLSSLKLVKRHEAAIHNDGVSYVCTICGKDTETEYYLTRHRKEVHKFVGKLKCTHCEQIFKWPRALREHIATHTGEDLYQCPHCPEKFKRTSRNHRHLREVHPVEFEEYKNNRLQLRKAKENRKINAD